MIAFEKTPLYIRIILPVLWYGFIFFLTELPFADGNNTRDAISNALSKSKIENIDTFEVSGIIDAIFRSSAHFSMFGIQSILMFFLIKPSFKFDKKVFWTVGVIIIGILGTMDEFHQSFVPERKPRIEDVLIDISGGLILLYSTLWLKSRYFNNYQNKNISI